MPTPKFRLTAADRAALLEDYLPFAEIVPQPEGPHVVPIACRDPDDAMFLSLALAAGTVLVSGDADLTALRGMSAVTVLSVEELRGNLPDII